MKKILIVIGAVLIAGLIAAGSFWGGMAYQSRAAEAAASQAQANFLNARGQADQGQLPNAGQRPAGGQAAGPFGGGGASGVVKSIDGNVLTISTALDVTTVNLSEDTQVEQFASAAIADLEPGMRVMVTGERESDDAITASQITILNSDAGEAPAFLEPPYPSPAGSEP